MIGRMLWERHLLKEACKVFFFFLLSFYFLYALFDYSMHVQEIIKSHSISLKHFFLYYMMLFSKRTDLLLPLALLIATLKVLCSLNRKNELIAFQAGGIGMKRLFTPFLFLGVMCASLTYLNFEYVTPRSLTFVDRFEKKYFRKKKSHQKKESGVHSLPLEDGTRLIYQTYDSDKNELFDVYWIFSADYFWHFKTLSLSGSVPIGHQVDEMKRNSSGILEKSSSFLNLSLPSLCVDLDLKHAALKPMENRSISELWKLHHSPKTLWTEKKNIIETHLWYKLLSPLLSLLVIIGVVPYASRFSRHFPVFILFSLGIFGYIALYTLMGASVILGESQVIPPFYALFVVPAVFFLFFGRKFYKMG